MNCIFEPALDIAHRFWWVNEDTLRLVNHEGIEREVILLGNEPPKPQERGRFVGLTNIDFKEKQFNVIPLYNPGECSENHLYYNKAELPLTDTLSRLRRKYQQYKSTYNFKD
jgi:hypothetical protein